MNKHSLSIPSRLEIEHELCRRDFGYYVEYVHKKEYIHGNFTRYLTKTVQDFIQKRTDNAYDILILSVPPQHSKSMTITETLPSWYLGKHPKHRVIEVSYNDDFAKRFIRKNTDKINEYGDIFGIKIGNISNANEFILDNNKGGMLSRGVLGGITGLPCELMVIDDPVKSREDADSETMRNKVWGEWLSAMKSRLAPNAKVILIMTRWHKDDFAGRMIENEESVTVINFPVECITETDVLGRKLGDSLFPEIKKDKAWMESFKRSYQTSEGSRAWNSLYMGKPSNEDGSIFMRSWFRYFEHNPVFLYKVISVDATFKEGENSDFVAIHVWAKTNNDYFLVQRYKKIMGFVDTLEAITQMIARHPDYKMILIEDKANGSAIVDVLTRKYGAVIPVKPEGSKIARASAVSPLFEAGNVYVRPEHFEYVDEMCDFPTGIHDDEVDASSQALNRLRQIIAEPYYKDPEAWDEVDQINSIVDYM